ncbi:chemotaxis protein CheC [Paludicola sp. MB14-C6]|uniref:chemotaxis protein CheC n=1 Tax=Paludihabitans sp. MB14-C6 TaxID=3070656 RepID=UPI0027DB4182|nr:chemotaxis protein CheC [Paludicola sp. MB14-C6]WMJ24227.1 chemotaxis protein CheC [Paludicola sp. MB14-C6]
MKINNLEQLNEMHIDVLKEIGNIGAGNAATSLSEMLNLPVDMSVPKVKILDIKDAGSLLGGPENVMVGILAKFIGDIEGIMMFLIEEKFVGDIIEKLMGEHVSFLKGLSEMELSAVSEIGNILTASYINAISSLTGLNINISVPAVAVDMVGALLAVPAIELSPASDQIIFIEGVLLDLDQSVSSNILLVPTLESLNIMMTRLGIEL